MKKGEKSTREDSTEQAGVRETELDVPVKLFCGCWFAESGTLSMEPCRHIEGLKPCRHNEAHCFL